MEAVFEFRFQPTVPNAGDVLPGLLFGDFRAECPTVEQTPLGTIPRDFRDKDPDFLYQPTHRLIGPTSVVQVGDRVVSLTKLYPYPGWARFREGVVDLLGKVWRTGLVREAERFSFRYLNIIAAALDKQQLPLLTVQADWPGHGFVERGFRLRFERDERSFITVVHITPHARAKKGDSAVAGLLVDVDTIRPNIPTDFWDAQATLLEDAHTVAKQTFYSLLTDATLEGLEPIYDDAI